MRFFGEERTLGVLSNLSLVTSLSCFSVPELRCVHCTRVIVSCAHEAGRRQRLLLSRLANDAAANGMNLLLHGAVGPQTRLNYAASILKFESWLEQREEKVVTDAEIDAAMCAWMENEFMKGNSASSGEWLLSVWMDKYPLPGGASRVGSASHLEARGNLGCVQQTWSRIARRLVEQGQHSKGMLVMTGLLSYARPRELLRMRQCDLVLPLRGALQNFSVILAAEETCRPTKVRTFNDTLELDGPLARKLVPFWKALRGQGSNKNPCGLSPIRFSAAFPESDNRFDVATNSTPPRETFWPVNRYSRWLLDVRTSQKARTMANHENCPTIREALSLRTKFRTTARKSPTTSPALRRTARVCVARRPAHGSSGTWWLLLKGHFVALIGSGTRQVCNELKKQGITARMWTGND